jgi:hypothetical protein
MAQAKQRVGNAGLQLGAQQGLQTYCPTPARTVLAIFSRYDEATGRSLAVLKVMKGRCSAEKVRNNFIYHLSSSAQDAS